MRAAAAAGHEQTARTAAAVLADGGNAVDATVAAAAMSWAAEPGLISPCGGGFLLVRPARSRQAAPARRVHGHPRPRPAARSAAGPARRRGRPLRRADDAGVPHRRGRLRRPRCRRRPRAPYTGASGRSRGATSLMPAAAAANEGVASTGGQQAVLGRDPGRPRAHARGARGVRARRPVRARGRARCASPTSPARSSGWPSSARATSTTAAWRRRWSTTRARPAGG